MSGSRTVSGSPFQQHARVGCRPSVPSRRGSTKAPSSMSQAPPQSCTPLVVLSGMVSQSTHPGSTRRARRGCQSRSRSSAVTQLRVCRRLCGHAPSLPRLHSTAFAPRAVPTARARTYASLTIVTRCVTIRTVNRFGDHDAQRLFAGQPVRRIPPDIQRRARMRLQRVLAAAGPGRPPPAALAPAGGPAGRPERSVQHPHQRPVARLLRLDRARRHADRDHRLPLRRTP